MTALAVTNTFVSGASITAAGHNTNFSDIVNYINNRNNASATWDGVSVATASAVPLIVNNSTGANAIAQFKDNGTTVVSVNDGGGITIGTGGLGITAGGIQAQDGGATTPTYSFGSATQTGIYLASATALGFTLGGTTYYVMDTGGVRPNSDGVYTSGATGNKWSAVWATNGTIQTSHSSTKTDIAVLPMDSLDIPRAITFKRPGNDTKTYLGFEADNLPPEAFAEDGVSVYTGAVIGVLCAHVKDLADRLAGLEAKNV